MLLHVVLLQPKPETAIEEMQLVLDQVKNLQQKIAGILDVEAGVNRNTTNHQGYTHGFVMRFLDEDHLNAYAIHPEHMVVSNELVRLCHRIIDFDLSC